VPATGSLARFAMRLNPRANLDAIAIRLMAAGMGRSLTPTAFLAMKGGGALIGGIVGFTLGTGAAGPVAGFLFAFGLGFGGFVIPGFIVGMRGRKRRELLRAQLPDALD